MKRPTPDQIDPDGEPGSGDERLKQALRGLGYLKSQAREDSALPGELDSVTKQAVNKLRRACGREETGEVDPWVRSELARQTAMLQRKLATLGHYDGPQHGVFDSATQVALVKFQRKPELEKIDPEEIVPAVEPDPEGVCGSMTRWILRHIPPYTFEETLGLELDAVRQGRELLGQSFSTKVTDLAHPVTRAHEARLMGLALSGGGIRSATFNLGALQALAQLGLLTRFDYLSSVSGGGYIAGWLHAWVHRAKGEKGISEVQSALAASTAKPEGAGSARDPTFHEPHQVRWLRRYSNYLTPQVGILSSDSMTGLATWLRNVLLNQAMLLSLTVALLCLPWLAATYLSTLSNVSSVWAFFCAFLAGLLAWAFAAFVTGFETALGFHACTGTSRGGRKELARLIVVLNALGAVLIGLSLALTPTSLDSISLSLGVDLDVLASSVWIPDVSAWILVVITGFGFTLFNIFGTWIAWQWDKGESEGGGSTSDIPKGANIMDTKIGRQGDLSDSGQPGTPRGKRFWLRVLASVVAGGALGGFLVVLFNYLLPQSSGDLRPAAPFFLNTVILGPPAVLAALLLAITLHTGIAGRTLQEVSREWWSRVTGNLIRFGLIWFAVTGVALYSAYGISLATGWFATLGWVTWVAITIAGLSYASKGVSRGWIERIVRLAPYVFVAGLVVLASWFVHGAIRWSAADKPPHFCSPAMPSPEYQLTAQLPLGLVATGESVKVSVARPAGLLRCHPDLYADQMITALTALAPWVEVTALALFALAWLLGLRVDINVFALHKFFGNRLERCYLGASIPGVRGHPYTDLDPRDSPRLDALRPRFDDLAPGPCLGQRPYPLINAALNLTSSANLAWQERKATSFIFTPDRCGYQLVEGAGGERGAYQKTADYVGESGGWLSLGTPLTVSGAAASPNAGYHTSPATAALMTVFNLRLGLWIQNPRDRGVWRKPGPPQALDYLLKELAATTTDADHFVYVSDGGHFENLGLYELVRRRCLFIILCDVGCDSDYRFTDLGNAIRKCKVDFGIDIDIDVSAIRPDPETGLSRVHCAVGRIHYERVDCIPAATEGYLLYIKATCTGDEPGDVRQYRAEHPCFPHEATTNQWYGESQFESYRGLGFHIMKTALEEAREDERQERYRRSDFIDQLRKTLNKIFESAGLPPLAGEDQQQEVCDRDHLFSMVAQRWSPASRSWPSPENWEQEYDRLFEAQRTDPHLGFLNAQMFPEWECLEQQISGKGASARQWPSIRSESELCAGFHHCCALIQIMEYAYNDLHLDREYEHPDHRGWMNLFRRWRGSTMFRATWAVIASTHGARFQQFCRRRLNLDVGRVVLGNRICMETPEAEVKSQDRFPWMTSAEGAQLDTLQTRYAKEWAWERIYLVPLVLQDEKAQKHEHGFQFQIGFALIEGSFPLEGIKGNERKLKFFRIRDHLRQMGLGRRGIEALWREQSNLLFEVPSGISSVIDEADCQHLDWLWQSMLTAVPHQEIERAKAALDLFDQEGEKDGSQLGIALKNCRLALAHQPDNESALRIIVRVLAHRADMKQEYSDGHDREHDWGDVFTILDVLIKKDPTASLAYYSRACMRVRRNKDGRNKDAWSVALGDLKTAIGIDPSLKACARTDKDFESLKHDSRLTDLIGCEWTGPCGSCNDA